MNESIELINRATEVLNQAGHKAIAEYAIWHLTSAIAWIIAGVASIIFSIKWKKIPIAWDENLIPFARGFLFLFGVLCLLFNVGDIASPEAISIHQLLKDIRG